MMSDLKGSRAATPGVSAARAIWLLTALRMKRVGNMLSAGFNRRRTATRGQPAGRQATVGKRRNRWVVSSLVGVLMLGIYGNIARQSFINLHYVLDHLGRVRNVAPSGAFSDALIRGLSMEFSLLLCVAFLGALASRELSQPDWDLEWLTTLPIRTPLLLWSRVIERSVATPIGLLTMFPTNVMLAWVSGYRWSAVFVGAAAALPLLLLASIARTLVDTGLRMSLSASRLRNLQAALSIISVIMLYIVISLGLLSPMAFILDWARNFPDWASWLPPGLVVRAVNAQQPATQLLYCAALIAEVGFVLIVGIAILTYQLRNGVVASSSRETGRKPTGKPLVIPAAKPSKATARLPFRLGSVVQRRELRLLMRDRTFMVQTLVLPVVIVVSQIFFQGRIFNGSFAGASNTAVATIAFVLASYTLMMSAFQTLNSEGGSLWLLYTVPRSIESILLEKARLWAVLALVYPLAVFIMSIWLRQRFDIDMVGLAAVVLLGVPIYTAIAVSLGVYGCDPLAQEAGAKLRPTYMYLYLMLAGLYTYAIYSTLWSQRLVLIVLSGLLGLALWQKARDELPYLLDPAASPPARVSTSDGVIAAMIFFVLQGVVVTIVMSAQHRLSGGELITAYTIGGATAFILLRYIYWRVKTQDVPKIFGAGAGRAIAIGAAAGVVAAGAGILYLYVLQRLDLLQGLLRDANSGMSGKFWIPILAIAAAPLFEEFIFRGLIFGGLRRSMGALPAILASAAVFAIVHPPASMIPVFGLGVCAGFAYERSRILLAPMLAHAIYNAAVIAYQSTL
jgi:ABC-2 type transport system permease protein